MRLNHLHLKAILAATKTRYMAKIYREIFHPAALCFLEESIYHPPAGSRAAIKKLAIFLHSRSPDSLKGVDNTDLEAEMNMATITHLVEMVERGWEYQEENEYSENLYKCVANSIDRCFDVVVPDSKTCLPYHDLCTEYVTRQEKGLI